MAEKNWWEQAKEAAAGVVDEIDKRTPDAADVVKVIGDTAGKVKQGIGAGVDSAKKQASDGFDAVVEGTRELCKSTGNVDDHGQCTANTKQKPPRPEKQGR